MNWLSETSLPLYLWASEAPVFVQVTIGVFAGMTLKAAVFVFLPSPRFALLGRLAKEQALQTTYLMDLHGIVGQIRDDLSELTEAGSHVPDIYSSVDEINRTLDGHVNPSSPFD